MEIEEVLDLANRFIVVKLSGVSGSVQPLTAKLDSTSGIWTVSCAFRRFSSTLPHCAKLEIDNKERKVVSFTIVQ